MTDDPITRLQLSIHIQVFCLTHNQFSKIKGTAYTLTKMFIFHMFILYIIFFLYILSISLLKLLCALHVFSMIKISQNILCILYRSQNAASASDTLNFYKQFIWQSKCFYIFISHRRSINFVYFLLLEIIHLVNINILVYCKSYYLNQCV